MIDQGYKDVAATPTGDSLLNPPRSYQVCPFAIGLQNPIDDIDSLKSFFSASIMLKIPRFSSLLLKHPNGKHYFRSTKVDIDKHFIVRCLIDNENPETEESEHEDLVNNYLAEVATAPPMSTDKPLWEIHVLADMRCLVLRIHHAIGDGVSLASMIKEIGNPIRRDERENKKVASSSSKGNFRWDKDEGLLGLLRYVWNTTVFVFDSGVRASILKDKRTMLKVKSTGQVGYRPRKLATARFNLDDVKLVKTLVPKATVNDVMCGIIWGGLKKYIAARSSSGDGIAPKEGQQITGTIMANIRRLPGLQEFTTTEGISTEKWRGNKTGAFLLPIRYTKKAEHAISFVRMAKSTLDKKKKSAEPHLVLQALKMVFHLFGQKATVYLRMRSSGKTTFGFTNVMGPSEQISIDDNPVTYLKFSLYSTPLGIMVHLLSYKKNLGMQILVDEDVIPDPKFLSSCFTDTFQEMMDALNDYSLM